MADVQISPMPVRERTAARVHAVVYTQQDERPQTDPISMFNTYEVDAYIAVGGRVVSELQLPVSVNVGVMIAAGADISVVQQPWQPSGYYYQYVPFGRWVADEDHVEESAGLAEKWHSVDRYALARPWYRQTGKVTELHSENVQVPQYSYRAGYRWVTSNAVSVDHSAAMRLDIDKVPGGSALLVIGTFDKAGSQGYRLATLSFGTEDLWFGVNSDDSFGVGIDSDVVLSVPSTYGPGRLTGVLLVDAPDGVSIVVRTVDGLQRSATSRGITSREIGPSSATLNGTSSGDAEYVETALWLGGPDMTLLRQQLASIMSYYGGRVRA